MHDALKRGLYAIARRPWNHLLGITVFVVMMVSGLSAQVMSQTSSSGGSYVAPDAVYREVAACILDGRYSDAEEAAKAFRDRFPEEPSGPLIHAAVIQYRSADYEDYSSEREFMSLLNDVRRLAGKKADGRENDLWRRYYLAAADGLSGGWRSSSGSLLKGVIDGRSGAKGMERILEDDSGFHDALLLVGSYRFWRSVAVRRVSWLPFIDTEFNAPVAMVETAIDKGKLTGPLSNTVLLEMLLEYKPQEAANLGERLNSQYPRCRLFAWQLGEAHKKLGRYEDAVRIFTGIVESMRNDPLDDGSGMVRGYWKLAVCAKEVGNTDDCMYYCKKVVEFGIQEPAASRQKQRIDAAKRLLDDLRSKH
jgi:tetratricopeptide (TPR) repeat protein